MCKTDYGGGGGGGGGGGVKMFQKLITSYVNDSLLLNIMIFNRIEHF